MTSWTETLRAETMSAGIYVLPAGTVDQQQPHGEDEVYFVISGAGAIEVDGERGEIGEGDFVFVPKLVPHRFVDITTELRLAVVFAPPEGSA
jgi:mannose-6-phosphate isomerase-like protein (cupin superfamily)